MTERDGAEGPARRFGFDTRQLHAGQRPDPNTGARAVPIFQTASYVFEDPESAAAYFNLQEYGNTYSRIMNPTVAVFEERIASLEGGAGAVAFSSGIAAQAGALFTLLEPGDHVVASSALYGGSVNQFKHLLRKMNVELTWVDPDDLDAWRGGRPRQHQGLLRRDDRQPGRLRARHRGRGRDRPRARPAADRSTTRSRRRTCAGRSSGAPTSSSTRPPSSSADTARASAASWSRRDLRLVKRAVPGRRRPLACLSRPAVPRDVRHVRLPDEAPRRDAARPRRDACRRSTRSCSCRDWRRCRCGWNATSPTPPRSRPSWSRTIAGLERDLSGSAVEQVPAAGQEVPAARCRRGLLIRRARRPGGGQDLIRGLSSCGRIWRTWVTPRAWSSTRPAPRTGSSAMRSWPRPASARARSGCRSGSKPSSRPDLGPRASFALVAATVGSEGASA